jgi:hypothetical protein
MRALISLFLAVLLASGCAANSFRIPASELARLAQTAPEDRGRRVRVIQEIRGTAVTPAESVSVHTQIVFIPNFNFTTDRHYRAPGTRDHVGGGGIRGGGGGGGGSGSDGKAAAIAVIVIAATALFIAAGIEGSRFDGWAELHPMHPVHLFGKDGGYTVVPLAWLDAGSAAWARKAVVRPSEGPWRNLERHPLDREGPTYGMYAGTGTLRSADGSLEAGPAFTIQLGYFFNQYVGVVGDLMLGWRDNDVGGTLFESRYMLELQAMPLALGPVHLGGYVGGGAAYRFEDSVPLTGNNGSNALTGGAMLQLDVNTRIALTARAGVTKAHEERMTDLIFGLSVY